MAKTVLLFNSVHHVLSAEEILEKANIDFEVVPLPEGLNAGCGMALEIDAKYSSKAVSTIEKEGVVCAGLHPE